MAIFRSTIGKMLSPKFGIKDLSKNPGSITFICCLEQITPAEALFLTPVNGDAKINNQLHEEILRLE